MHRIVFLLTRSTTITWGLEARVLFLDKEFLEVVMDTNAEVTNDLNTYKEVYNQEDKWNNSPMLARLDSQDVTD